MKYPYIGELLSGTGVVAIFLNDYKAAPLNDSGDNWKESEIFIYSSDFHSPSFKNITREYLSNTYGKVQSPEHAEFIIELAESAGLGIYIDHPEINKAFFAFNESPKLFFYDSEDGVNKDRCKKITIPPPPKADSKKWTPDFYDLGEPPKHFDCVCNKCGGKCCTGQCDKQELSEWLQIGCLVTWGDMSVTGELKGLSKSDGAAWVKNQYGIYFNTHIDLLQKPKTPEEELRDDIELIIKESLDEDYSPSANAEHITSEILDKYNITKKPQ